MNKCKKVHGGRFRETKAHFQEQESNFSEISDFLGVF